MQKNIKKVFWASHESWFSLRTPENAKPPKWHQFGINSNLISGCESRFRPKTMFFSKWHEMGQSDYSSVQVMCTRVQRPKAAKTLVDYKILFSSIINEGLHKRYLAENCKEVLKRKLLYPKLCDTSSTFRGLYFHKSKAQKQKKYLKITLFCCTNMIFDCDTVQFNLFLSDRNDCPTFITPTFITSDIHHLRHSSPPT